MAGRRQQGEIVGRLISGCFGEGVHHGDAFEHPVAAPGAALGEDAGLRQPGDGVAGSPLGRAEQSLGAAGGDYWGGRKVRQQPEGRARRPMRCWPAVSAHSC